MNLENAHDDAEEEIEIALNSIGEIVRLTKEFTYLGSVMIFLYEIDVQNILIKDSKAIGALRLIWDSKEVPIGVKVKLFQ